MPKHTKNAIMSPLRAMSNYLVSRTRLSGLLGTSFGGKRDTYEALGYPKLLTYEHYVNLFERGDIARRIIEAFPYATWRGMPDIYTIGKPDNDPFHEQWKDLVSKHRLYHYFNRVDTLAGIGHYAVLLLGINDSNGGDFSRPAQSARELLYVAPYTEDNAEIVAMNEDVTSPRFGYPEMYRVTMTIGPKNKHSVITKLVHWTRIVHVAEGLVQNEIYGTPRLQAIYNRIEDLSRVVGGSSEMFWKGAFPGYAFNAENDADWDDQSIEEFNEELEEYFHNMKRYLRLQNTNVQSLSQQVADPSHHLDVIIKIISGTTGIPARILTGSERGELASTQDEDNWNSRVDERRRDFAEPSILRQFIDRMGELGILDVPEKYTVRWPGVDLMTEKDKADVGYTRTKALSEYVRSGSEVIMPPLEFLTRVMDIPEDEAVKIIGGSYEMLMEEENQDIEFDMDTLTPSED